MSNIRFLNIYLIISLLCSIVIPAQAANFTDLKKSFSRNVHQFLACLKGDKNCSPQSVKVVRAGTALVGTIILASTGAGIYYLKTKKAIINQPQGPITPPSPITPTPPTATIEQTTDEGHTKIPEPTVAHTPISQPKMLSEQEQININNELFQYINRTAYDNPQAVNDLVQKGANVNMQTVAQKSLLSLAAITDLAKIAQALINHGANINAQEQQSGETAIMVAARNGNPGVVKVLIDNQANLNIKDRYNRTVFDIAFERATTNPKNENMQKVKALLDEVQAKQNK